MAVNYGEAPETVREAVRSRGYDPYRVLVDERGTSLARWQVLYRPTTFFVDGKGVIRSVWAGPLTAEQVQTEAARLF